MKLTWAQDLGQVNCPYIRRWILDFGPFSIRFHHWLSSDDQRNYHDHPSWFITLILKGSYTDISPAGRQVMKPGSIVFRPAEYKHTVEVPKTGCWSLLLVGRETRTWGFWVNGKFRKRNKYFFEHGHHQCDQ